MIIILSVNDVRTLPRLVARDFAQAGKSAPIRVLTGARQTGKSTLVQSLGVDGSHAYVTLDDFDVLERALAAPDALVRQAPKMTVDEVQRAPNLLLAVKRVVDERRRPGRFILTGSANLLMRRLSETLAGRAVYFTLWPMTRREQLGWGSAGQWSSLFDTKPEKWNDLLLADKAERESWRELALRGGYPTPAHELKDTADRALWFAGYTRTYLERDVQDLGSIGSLLDFRRLMRAACLRLGTLVNQTEIARDVGLSQPTVHRHLNVLETSYQLVRLPPYSINRTKRLIKTPKLYWADTGLALHLAGETELRGEHLENVILADLLAWGSSMAEPPSVMYWRTAAGEEVDFVIEWKNRLLPVEVKSAATVRMRDTAHLRSFRDEYGKKSLPGLVLYDGDEVIPLGEGVLAAPWWKVI